MRLDPGTWSVLGYWMCLSFFPGFVRSLRHSFRSPYYFIQQASSNQRLPWQPLLQIKCCLSGPHGQQCLRKQPPLHVCSCSPALQSFCWNLGLMCCLGWPTVIRPNTGLLRKQCIKWHVCLNICIKMLLKLKIFQSSLVQKNLVKSRYCLGRRSQWF